MGSGAVVGATYCQSREPAGIANQIVKIAPRTKTMNSKIAPGKKKNYFKPCISLQTLINKVVECRGGTSHNRTGTLLIQGYDTIHRAKYQCIVCQVKSDCSKCFSTGGGGGGG